MPLPIEGYALIGDTQTAALVGRDGSIDWICFPRFDSAACFAALLGEPRHGRWRIAPRAPVTACRRAYRKGTLVLDTELDTADGTIRITDFMPPREHVPDVVRIVEGVRGRVEVEMELVIRFDYGSTVPWVHRTAHGLSAVAGPNALLLRSPIPTHGEDLKTVATFALGPGERAPFSLSWHPSHEEPPLHVDPLDELEMTEGWWRSWCGVCAYGGPWIEEVKSSLVVLKALTFAPTGGIVAAPTTSLPEWPGGVRNWDYRYCWLRDATLSLYALMLGGYKEEAVAWRDWLLRAAAGDPKQLQIMYGLAGERHLPEFELPLPGYEGATPVRIGNAAADQLQLDVYGEVMDALYQAGRIGIPPDEWAWGLQKKLLEFLETGWTQPDQGIWEVRGPRRHFVHSKVMCWVAFDRAVKIVESGSCAGPAERWRRIRDQIHEEVCRRGFDPARGAFTQSYDSPALDASVLMIPIVGFLPADDPRMIGTVRAIERHLLRDGFVLRYQTEESGAIDGLPAGEGAFLACSFWLADAYALMGREDDARALFERLLDLRNDVGLLAEEYDPRSGRLLGNFPQALSHLALVNTAYNLTAQQIHPAGHRRAR